MRVLMATEKDALMDAISWGFPVHDDKELVTYREVELRNLWKSWESEYDVEEIQTIRERKVAKNPVKNPTLRTSRSMLEDRPPDNGTIAVCS